MKKSYILIAGGVLLALFAFRNFTLEIDSKAHYFVNGILFGIGISTAVAQTLKLSRRKK